jgi:hypothetical protein
MSNCQLSNLHNILYRPNECLRFAAPLAVIPLESVTVLIVNRQCRKTHRTLIINRRRDGIVGIVVGYGLKVRVTVVRFRTEATDLLTISIFIWVLRGSVCGPGSSVGIATELRDGRSGDRIPVGARFFAHVQTGPGAHPASCTMGTGYFRGVRRPGRGADHPPPFSAEVENYNSTLLPL